MRASSILVAKLGVLADIGIWLSRALRRRSQYDAPPIRSDAGRLRSQSSVTLLPAAARARSASLMRVLLTELCGIGY